MISRTFPIKLPSLANCRFGWRKKARIIAEHRLLGRSMPRGVLPCIVTLTRIGPRTLDTDNNISCFKGWRDGVADSLGVSDNDPRIEWRYRQEKGAYAVRIEIDPA